jgi:hypothetical protein
MLGGAVNVLCCTQLQYSICMYGMLTNFTFNQYNLTMLVNLYGYMFMP